MSADPVPRHSPTDERKRRALVAYSRHGTVQAACDEAGIGRRTWYAWAAADPEFARRAQAIQARTSVPMEVQRQMWLAVQRTLRAELGASFVAVEGKVRDAIREVIRSTDAPPEQRPASLHTVAH